VALSVSGGSRQVVEAIRLGTTRLLERPFAGDRIAASAQTLLGRQNQRSSDCGLDRSVRRIWRRRILRRRQSKMRKVRLQAELLANIDVPAASFLGKPFSPEAEAVRGLQISILLANPDSPPRLLLVASPFPKEGKTTLAINLAVALSQVGTTCLVVADLRKSGVAAALNMKCGRGLSDVLRGSVPLKEALVGMPRSPRLTILPAGLPAGTFDQLLILDRMRNLVRVLNESCQYIVIDSPPLVPYADGRVLSSMVDGVILVGRYSSTSRQAMARCAQMLALLRAPVLGVVLNGVDSASPDYRYHSA